MKGWRWFIKREIEKWGYQIRLNDAQDDRIRILEQRHDLLLQRVAELERAVWDARETANA